MTLRTKFGILIAFLVTIALTVIGINIRAYLAVTERFEELTDRSAPALIALEDANTAAARMREEAVGVALLINEDADEADWREDLDEVNNAWIELQAVLARYEELSVLEDRTRITNQLHLDSQDTRQAVYTLIGDQMSDKVGLIEYKETLEATEDAFVTHVRDAIALETAHFDHHLDQTENLKSLIQVLNWGSIALGTVFVFGAAYTIIRQIIKPVVEMKDAAIRLGQGNLDQRVTVTSSDEIGVLSQQFNIMAANLQQRIMESQQLAENALESSAFKSSLIARVSHELRSPLGAILGVAEMLVDGGIAGPLSDEQISLVDRIIHNSHDLTKLVNELLEQSRLDASRLKLRERAFTPREMIQHILATQEILAQEKTIALSYDVDDALPPTLWGDPDRLEQVVSNLVYNAIKFTDTGSITVRVTLPDADHWAIAVRDTGIGIPQEAQNYIFEAFRQVDESTTRKHNGLGLGLSIVQQITQAMNGVVSLDSEVGRGSTFTVVLPLTLPESEEIREPELASVGH